MTRIKTIPLASGEHQIIAPDFIAFKQSLSKIESWPQAAEKRFAKVQQLMEYTGDDDFPLDWEHNNTRAAIEVIYASAIDSLNVGEVEMAAALWENILGRKR